MPIKIEPEKHHTIIGGIVVGIVLLVLLYFILFFSGVSIYQYQTYVINMNESVSGISMDSDIEYNGVVVGSVKSILINKKNPSLVEIIASISKDALVTRGTVATIESSGLTGNSSLELSDFGTDLRPIEIKPGQKYPVIPTRPSIYMQLNVLFSKLDTNFTDIHSAFAAVLNKDDIVTLRDTINNSKKISSIYTTNTDMINAIVKNSTTAGLLFSQTYASGHTIINTIELQMLPVITQLYLNFENVAETLKEAFKAIKAHPTALIFGVQPPQGGPGENTKH